MATLRPILYQSKTTVQRLKAMPYSMYLRTPYWKAVAAWMKTKHPKCQYPGCNVPSYKCDTHHDITRDAYAFRGEESEYHLKVLCTTHHDKAHRRKAAPKKTRIAGIGRMVKRLYHSIVPPKPELMQGDFIVFLDALSCYLDYMKRAGMDKKAADLYADVARTRERTTRFTKALLKAPKDEPFTIHKG